MQIPVAQLAQHLGKGLQACYVLVGDEPLGQMECQDTIRRAARKQGVEERTSLTVERNFNWAQITHFGQSISLFASVRLLEIHISSGKPGVEGAKTLTQIATQPMQDTFVMVVLPNLEREAKNSVWFQTLEKSAVIVPIQDVLIQQLPTWLAGRLQQQNQQASSESLQFIAHQVEGNLLAASQEVQKLGLLYPAGMLQDNDVKNAVLNVARHDAFQLGEATLGGDAVRVARIIESLKEEGEQIVAVMNPLIWLIRPLARLKQAGARGENLQNAMVAARIFGERQTLTKRALARLSARQLEAAVKKLSDIDRIAKGVMVGDAWLEISRLCHGLASVGSERGRLQPPLL